MTVKVYSYVKLSSLRRAIRKRLDDDGVKPIYVLPSKSNEYLLLDMLRRSGNYFASRPEVLGWRDIYNRIVPRTERRRCVDPPDHFLILRYVRNLVAAGAPVPPGVLKRGFVVSLGEAVNELLLEDVDPEMIRGHDLLYGMYSGYLSYLAAHGLADSSELPSLTFRALRDNAPNALNSLKTFGGRTMRWIGFMSFTGAQLKLIKALCERGVRMEFFVPDSGGVNFRDASAQLGIPAQSVETGECVTRRVVSRDIYSQCEFIADFIARRFSGENDAIDCGILSDPGTALPLTTALSRMNIPWQSRSEVTVDRTVIIDAAREAFETHKAGWPPARTANLLRGPAFGVLLDTVRFAQIMPEGLSMWREFLSGDEGALGTLSRLESFCSLLGKKGGSTAEELLRGLYDLHALSEGGLEAKLAAAAEDDPEMDPVIREIVSSRLEIEGKLAMMEDVTPSLGEASLARFEGRDALEFLVSWAKEAATALPPRYKGAVSIYESPPPVLIAHDLWIMTGVEASRYPGAPSDHALLSENLREEVNSSPFDFTHLPTIHEKRSQKEAMFRRLLAVGEELTITTRAAFDAAGNQVSESPFMRRENFENSRWVIEEETDGNVSEKPLPRIRRIFPRFALSGDTTQIGGKPRVSLGQIDRLLDCPFAYWCERTARFESPPDAGEILDRRCLGNVMHDIWKRVTEAAAERGTAHSPVLLSEWDSIITSLSSAYPLLADARTGYALSGLRMKISAAANIIDDMWALAAGGGMKRLWTRAEYDLPVIETGDAIFAGRADRVDFWTWPGGEGAILLDFKLGGNRNYGKSAQLAAYGAALRNAGIPVAGFFYLCHGDAKKIDSWLPGVKEIIAPRTRGATCEEGMNAALELIAEAGRIVAGGRFEANYDSESCRSCGYTTICRRGERWGDYDAPGDTDDAEE